MPQPGSSVKPLQDDGCCDDRMSTRLNNDPAASGRSFWAPQSMSPCKLLGVQNAAPGVMLPGRFHAQTAPGPESPRAATTYRRDPPCLGG